MNIYNVYLFKLLRLLFIKLFLDKNAFFNLRRISLCKDISCCKRLILLASALISCSSLAVISTGLGGFVGIVLFLCRL